MTIIDKLRSNNLDIYNEGLFDKNCQMNSTGEKVLAEEKELMEKSFKWYLPGPVFVDLFEICSQCLPILKRLRDGLNPDDMQYEELDKITVLIDGFVSGEIEGKNFDEEISTMLMATSLWTEMPPFPGIADLKELLSEEEKQKIGVFREKFVTLTSCQNIVRVMKENV